MLQLGVVMLERGSHKEALDNFELALNFDPKHRVRNVFVSVVIKRPFRLTLHQQ